MTDIARITNAAGGANIDDVEGLSFYGDGACSLQPPATMRRPATPTSFAYLDKSSAVATYSAVLGTQLTYNDYEAVACQGGSLNTTTTPEQRGGRPRSPPDRLRARGPTWMATA